jgi:hypothetical protein
LLRYHKYINEIAASAISVSPVDGLETAVAALIHW